VIGREYLAAGPTLQRFHDSDAFVRMLRGPVGSGKTSACVAEILRRAHMQAPGPDGRRKTRWAGIRNTYGELKTTTLKTFHDWLPAHVGRYTEAAPPIHRLTTREIDLEVIFLALDRPEDVKKLLSLELTGAWLHEAREVPKAVLDMLTGRVGRYPSVADGGCTWSGIIGDTNPPDDDHWLYRLAEEERPEGFFFFAQPSGLSEKAENLQHLPGGRRYYERMQAGKSAEFVKVYIGGEYGYVGDDRPVYPEYSDSAHVAPEPLQPVEGLPLFIGIDFGLTPAAIFGQRMADGRWLILDEMVSDDMGVVRFSEALGARIAERYDGFEVSAWGDPAGNARAQTDERTCLQIVEEYANVPCASAPTNEFSLRREAVALCLNRMVDGKAAFQLDARCKMLRKGFMGRYHYKRIQIAGEERYKDVPDKNAYSHPHDGLQYLLSGAGEARVVMRDDTRKADLRKIDPLRGIGGRGRGPLGYMAN
jgi:hypothetical protein